MMLYIVLGVGGIIIGALIAAYISGRRAGIDRERVGNSALDIAARNQAIDAQGRIEHEKALGEKLARAALDGDIDGDMLRRELSSSSGKTCGDSAPDTSRTVRPIRRRVP